MKLQKSLFTIVMKYLKKLGPGLLESVYEAILAYELEKMGLNVVRQGPIPVVWETVRMDVGFRFDLLVEKKAIVESKSIEKTAPVHGKRLLTYLK